MSEDAPSNPADVSSPNDCPLSIGHQRRNMALFAINTGLIYLAAPVVYIGVTQATLCKQLGANDRISNLPAALYSWMTVAPVLIAWRFPQSKALKPLLCGLYSIVAVTMILVGVTLTSALADSGKIGFVVAEAVVSGICMPTAIALQWEALGRGVALHRRGIALGLTYSVGPLLACVGSLGQQLILDRKLGIGSWSWELEPSEFPSEFAMLFLIAGPLLAVAAILSSRFVVPPLPLVAPVAAADRPRSSFGLSKRDARVLGIAALVTVLAYTGNLILSNMTNHAPNVLGGEGQRLAGYENALRFGGKALAGGCFGWLVARSHPKAGMLATMCVYYLAVVWALFIRSDWYLVAFALYGAGELAGVYCPNYILAASRPRDTRRNMAWSTMLMAVSGPAGFLFGWLADRYGVENHYAPGVGYQISFGASALLIGVGIVVAVFFLPSRPRPDEPEPPANSAA